MVVYTFNKHSGSRGRLNSVSSRKFKDKLKDSRGYLVRLVSKPKKEKVLLLSKEHGYSMYLYFKWTYHLPRLTMKSNGFLFCAFPVWFTSTTWNHFFSITTPNHAASLWHLYFGFLVLFHWVLISYSSLERFYSQTCYPLATQRFLYWNQINFAFYSLNFSFKNTFGTGGWS